MTNRNKRFTRRSTRRRTGRTVWVNKNLNFSLSDNTKGTVDLLTAADDFMLFDSTVLGVLITSLTWSYDTVATLAVRQLELAIIQAKSTIDPDDFTSLYSDNVGPPYMWRAGAAVRSPISTINNYVFTPNGAIFIKAKRRFKENDSTIWLVHHTSSTGTNTGMAIDGTIRTLIYIP